MPTTHPLFVGDRVRWRAGAPTLTIGLPKGPGIVESISNQPPGYAVAVTRVLWDDCPHLYDEPTDWLEKVTP